MRLEAFDPGSAARLAAHLSARGFVVVRRAGLLHVHLRHHVSDRYDRLKVEEALRDWAAAGGGPVLVEPRGEHGAPARREAA